MANVLLMLSQAAEAAGEHHVEPSAFGLTPMMWVSLSMATLIAIAFYVKVPKMLLGGLDASIADIRRQLDEAKALRAEAEALRKEYADKIAGAEKDAAAMLGHARSEAEAIVAKAEVDSKAMVERRKKMAEDKISAAEREGIDRATAELRTAASGTGRVSSIP